MRSSFAAVYSCHMHSMDDQRNAFEIRSGERLQTPLHSGSAALRRAIRRNIISFPSQIPVFLKRPPADMQWRMVLLYFVRGWSSAKIASRFNVPTHWIRKSLNEWSVRALALGFVQVIDPEAFAACCHAELVYLSDYDSEDCAEVRPALASDSQRLTDAASAAGAPGPMAPEATRLGGMRVDSLEQGADLIAALDASIAHCEEWRDEFWVRTATLLRDLREVAAATLQPRHASEQTFNALEDCPGATRSGLRVCEEERVSHAVA